MKTTWKKTLFCTVTALLIGLSPAAPALAASAEPEQSVPVAPQTGGGYAVSGQLENLGYSAVLYDAESGLPTSDANCILASSDGYMWIGGYGGIFKYDGNIFERQDGSTGLTNGRAMFEDRNHNIWVGTNDNGLVVMRGNDRIHITYKEGLPASSVRCFSQDDTGTVWVGTTNGIAWVDEALAVHVLQDPRLENTQIVRMTADADGKIYGCTWEGDIFCIESGEISAFYNGESLRIPKVDMIYADPQKSGKVYIGCESDSIYYGDFGTDLSEFRKLSIAPMTEAVWIERACGRIWVNSHDSIGYLNEVNKFQVLKDVPFNNSIEMMTSDYQGNLWYVSTRQGVMKLVSSHFRNLTDITGLKRDVINATCMRDGKLYIGADNGLQILNSDEKLVENELTRFIGGNRIRCITLDPQNNLWICCYKDDKGVICYTPDEKIISYTTENGLIDNATRCATVAQDGSILVGTNTGVSVIRDGAVVKSYGKEEGVTNSILTVESGRQGEIYVGTDGDGIFVIKDDSVRQLGRDDGLTSDVVMRIKWDEQRGVYWIITSNSIEYMKGGQITPVNSFPYNNNFDIYYDKSDQLWILSSYGLYCADAQEMLRDDLKDYRLYNTANGMPGVPTANSFSELQENGMLYICGRTGVCRVNIDHFTDRTEDVKLTVRSVVCEEGPVLPETSGLYTIPANAGRIQISVSVLDYSLSNPTVHVFLEGTNDPGITATQRDLTPLEFSSLAHGSYTLHIQVIDTVSGSVLQDAAFRMEKIPKLTETLIVRVMAVALLGVIGGLIVWRIMTGTVIRKQYEMIRQARDEAERANSAKSRFLANMSHEIRTPINTIMGMDEMILRENADDVPKGYFISIVNYALDIRNASETLLGLINDLLDISKIESGKMHLVEQEYDTAELLRSIVGMIRVRSGQKDLYFDVSIDEKLPVRLYGDAGKIKQVILNLLTNAVKYTEEGGFTLTVSVEEHTQETCRLRISVKDTGIGVKPEDMEKLFTAYERLDEEKNSGIQGTGLGLDISRRFAELMNGRLWCESEYGKGSEFIFTLEQKIVDANGIGVFREHDEGSRGPYVPQFVAPDAEVLVVDDNPMNLTVIKGLLKATRIFVTTAESGEECLEKLKYGTFNVVLLDHMMPGMDGVETVAKIRETMPDLPVYALTANAAAGGEEFYKSKGFTGYLAKPIDSVALERAIMRHLPEEIMMKPAEEMAAAESDEFPEDMYWLEEVEGISVPDGIKNSGGPSAYIFSLNMFLDTIDVNAKVIEDAYEQEEIRLYTVKVHALKSSLRIIGAMSLSSLAENLEDAGNRRDMTFIHENTEKLLTQYRAFKEKLARLRSTGENDDSDKEPIPDEELREAYEALREVVPQMDYDAVEMILAQVREYRLPPEEDQKIAELEGKLKLFAWDEMEKILGIES